MHNTSRHALALVALITSALLCEPNLSLSQDSHPRPDVKQGKSGAEKPTKPEISISDAFAIAIRHVQKTHTGMSLDKGKWKITITGDNKKHRWVVYFWPTPGPVDGDFSVFVNDDGSVKP